MRGSELSPQVIRQAYLRGVFPMGEPATGEVEFYRPRVRALFPIEGVRVSRSLARTLRSGRFEVRFDERFEEVMRGCLRPRDNWITEDLIRVYTEIHREGWAHSAETYEQGRLVGGVYGLAIGACFCAESMFHRRTDASKVALASLVRRCRDLGFTLFDAQLMNPHLASLGAYEVDQETYMELLDKARKTPTVWDPLAGAEEL
jgi:leucyl/phenylalanyl-tRNA--protein transferase